ncbi:hypothetical protein DAPPUDRAFT_244148 [Daphnia pulex]|uniref:Uncharacterized protein n=1 Tax=Daphnia pulex TaxID=6669 RepID=E9GKB3_DAPPU|nr:hypothetical protein DAPPUDRAFT_244148 [Daphnia pulex]|eukprot:EFX79956.1 hypothetical protein DAPPUDRAFT_244148 [Daphnia pulex]
MKEERLNRDESAALFMLKLEQKVLALSQSELSTSPKIQIKPRPRQGGNNSQNQSDHGVKWHQVHISGSTLLYTPPDINFTCDISSRTAFGLQVRPPLYQTGKGTLVVSAHIDKVPRPLLRIAEDGITDIAIKLSYLQWSGHLYSRLVFTVYGRMKVAEGDP